MDVTGWLLDADPSIRWQVMRDLTDQPADVVAAERARIATEGWGAPDPRCAEAIELVRERQLSDGRWPLQHTHRARTHFEMEEGDGKPSRWNTLRALRVLRWYDGGPVDARGIVGTPP